MQEDDNFYGRERRYLAKCLMWNHLVQIMVGTSLHPFPEGAIYVPRIQLFYKKTFAGANHRGAHYNEQTWEGEEGRRRFEDQLHSRKSHLRIFEKYLHIDQINYLRSFK